MNSSFSQLACPTPTVTYPSGRMQDFELGGLQDCFSEFDTEVCQPESNRIGYVAQLMSLRNVRHLSMSQQVGRRFLLNMLQTLDDLSANPALSQPGQIAGWDPNSKFRHLIFLLERCFDHDLAQSVRNASLGNPLSEEEIVSLGRWLDRNGLDISELGLIQPGIFRPANALPQPKGSKKFAPKFADLIQASRDRNIDYLAGAFFGISQKISGDEGDEFGSRFSKPRLNNVHAGRGEAIASIFGVKLGQESSNKGRLKAVAIPTTQGEPLFALSFTNDF